MEADIEENKKKVQNDLELLQQRQKEAETLDGLPPLRMSSCRWGPAQVRQFDEVFNGDQFSASKVAELRRQMRVEIGPPDLEVRNFLAGLRLHDNPAKPARPPWLGLVCKQRQLFAQCNFKFVGGPGEEVYARPTFIRQSPFVVGFVRLEMAVVRLGGQGADNDCRAALLADWNHVFSIDCASYCFSDRGDIDPDWTVFVLTDSVLRAGGFVVSEAERKSMDDLRAWFPGDQEADVVPEVADAVADAVDPEAPVWAKLPWLLEHFPGHGNMEVSKGAAKHKVADDLRQEDDMDTAEDDNPAVSAEDIINLLYERRFQLEATVGEVCDFKVQLRGGQWTAEKTGMAYDSFRGYAMLGEASHMCARYHLGATATFSIRAYGENGAQRLATLWCHRMQWYLDLLRAHGREEDFVFLEVELQLYEEPVVELELAGEMGVVFRRRLETIRAMKPR
jgi:hypothetical protein